MKQHSSFCLVLDSLEEWRVFQRWEWSRPGCVHGWLNAV